MKTTTQAKASPIAGLFETGSFAGLGRLADQHRLQILSQEQHLQSALSPNQNICEVVEDENTLVKS